MKVSTINLRLDDEFNQDGCHSTYGGKLTDEVHYMDVAQVGVENQMRRGWLAERPW
jgi:hypothetical protein